MRKLIILLSLSGVALAGNYVISPVSTGQKGEKTLYGYHVLRFSTTDKALYFAEGLTAKCKCPVWIYSGTAKGLDSWLKVRSFQCLLKQVEEVEYPPNFNKVLFIKDLHQRAEELKIYFKEDVQCIKRKSLQELLPQLRELTKDIALEVEKFFVQPPQRESGAP